MTKKLLTIAVILLLALNAKAQWVQLPFEQENLNAIYFKDANTGYIASEGTEELLPKLFKTADGGMNWTEIILPNVGNYTRITTIHFFDDNIGFLTTNDGYSSLRTTDGGQNWQQISCTVEGYPGKAYFKNDGTGFYYNDDLTGIIFYTDNFGAIWQQSSIEIPYIYQINFINDEGDIGYIHTDWGVYKTTDNLQTVNNIFSGEGNGNTFFYNENIGLVGTSGGIYKTSNGGINWNYIFPFFNNKVFLISEEIGFAIASFSMPEFDAFGRVYKTLDGGDNWQEMYVNDGAIMQNVGDFCFPDNNTGYAIKNNYVYKLDVAASLKNTKENTMIVYPVPAKDVLNIHNTVELVNTNYQIIDLTGKIVAKDTITSGTIPVDNLANGTYILKIGENKAIKFIKE